MNEYPLPAYAPYGYPQSRGVKDIAAGPDGKLWFTEQLSGSIGVMTTGGIVTAEYPIPTVGSPGAAWPVGITAGPDGALWFAISGNCNGVQNPTVPGPCEPGAIGRITTAGQLTKFPIPSTVPPGPTAPWPQGITAGPDGAVWFTDPGTSSIGRITTTGTVTEYAVPNSAPWNITTGPDGNLWFTSGGSTTTNQIGKITPSGQINEYPLPDQTTNSPDDITSGPDGALWFTASSVVGRITTAASMLNTTITEYPLPHCCSDGITASNGALWVAGSYSGVVDNVTTAGVVTEYPVPTGDANPFGIARGSDGNLWFAENGANAVGFLGPPLPPPQLSISDASVQEPASGQTTMTFTVTLSRPAIGVSVYATTAPGTATDPEDYTYVRTPLTFPANATTATVSVRVNADSGGRTEYFYLNLSSPTNAVIADGQGVGTVLQH